jgi:hypothetical protein
VQVLDRYLEAVGGWLPRGQRADIVAELREDLRSEVEEREGHLGRALSEDELAAILKRRGHPMAVAEGYLPSRHLIGPAMLPHYRRVVAVVVGVVFTLALVGYALFSGPVGEAVPALRGAFAWLWFAFLVSLGYVGLFTVIFTVVELLQRRAQATGRWDPRDPSGLTGDRQAAERRSARLHAAADAATDLLLLAVWLGVHPALPPQLGIVLTPLWPALHWPVAAYLAASIAVGLADTLRPSSTRGRTVARVCVDALALTLVAVFIAGAPWVQITGPAIPAETARMLEHWLNASCLVFLLVVGAFFGTRVVRQVIRVRRAGPTRS